MARRQLEGRVISDKMKKTVVVTVETLMRHPVYLKRILRTKRYKVHDELGAKIGDRVKIEEARPLSRWKRFKVIEILKREET